jgi:aspartate ammonia-lyase
MHHLINIGKIKLPYTLIATKAVTQVFSHVLKMGRTHLQDAVPMAMGDEFRGFATNLDEELARIEDSKRLLSEVNMGATAIGTSVNAPQGYPELVLKYLREVTAIDLKLASDLVEATSDTGAYVQLSGVLKRTAVKLSKICNDLRLLASGPRCGLNEINLPQLQPGSSIMPGKVNPSVPEMVNQVCFQVIGCDATIAAAADAGQLELNVMMPVIAWNALHASAILTQALTVFRTRTVEGLEADADQCRALLDRSTAVATALSPYLGYAATAEIAKTAVATNRSIRQIVLERGLMTAERLDAVLSPAAMTEPGVPGEDR